MAKSVNVSTRNVYKFKMGEASRPGPADCSVELFNRVRKI